MSEPVRFVAGEMKILMRLSTLKDLQEYTDLLQRTYTDAYTEDSLGLTKDCFSRKVFVSESTQDYLKSHLINNKKQRTWLAFTNSKMVGSITCIHQAKDECELTGFYVAPEYQNLGIGKKLYELALEFAVNKDLILDIYTHNTRAIEIYKKWEWKLDITRGKKRLFYPSLARMDSRS